MAISKDKSAKVLRLNLVNWQNVISVSDRLLLINQIKQLYDVVSL